MLNSVVAAQSSHTFIYRGMDVTTDGNDLAHVILRGGVDKVRQYAIRTTIMRIWYGFWKCIMKMDLKNPAAVIDTNHLNSNKQFKGTDPDRDGDHAQPELQSGTEDIDQRIDDQSYLEEGCQSIGNERVYGKSITDPCLGWEDTERLIFEIAEQC